MKSSQKLLILTLPVPVRKLSLSTMLRAGGVRMPAKGIQYLSLCLYQLYYTSHYYTPLLSKNGPWTMPIRMTYNYC